MGADCRIDGRLDAGRAGLRRFDWDVTGIPGDCRSSSSTSGPSQPRMKKAHIECALLHFENWNPVRLPLPF